MDNQALQKLTELYSEMQEAYDKVALLLDFSCDGCPDNCCDSYFQHYTYIEWAYLMEGFDALPEDERHRYRKRAQEYIVASEKALAAGERPEVMCPLNDDGRCGLYGHRLLICRLHGVPGGFTLPSGDKRAFPGCDRCQELNRDKPNTTALDRTLFFRKMAALEDEFIGRSRMSVPKVKMTIAEMLLRGAPKLEP